MEVSVWYLVIKIGRAQIISSRKGDECHPHLKQIGKRSALEGRLANNDSKCGRFKSQKRLMENCTHSS